MVQFGKEGYWRLTTLRVMFFELHLPAGEYLVLFHPEHYMHKESPEVFSYMFHTLYLKT
jgi:hypothetical protein